MLTKYVSAQSLTGTIDSETSDGKGTVKNLITVSYQRPTFISVHMTIKGRNGLPMSLVSDGENFRYDPPMKESLVPPQPRERLIEPVTVKNQLTGATLVQDIGMIYNAAHASLVASTALDILIGFRAHLKDLQIHVATLNLIKTNVADDGSKTYLVGGTWRQNKDDQALSTYQMLISDQWDLLQFRLVEPIGVNNKLVPLTITEKVNVKTDVPVPASTFKID
ncbi:MAG TPA: hypothetical protein VNI20_00690 [Fimbriimonadaceae bacterium]|nr:hypothetical protein [Fimbriimonadaceae bacterium]